MFLEISKYLVAIQFLKNGFPIKRNTKLFKQKQNEKTENLRQKQTM